MGKTLTDNQIKTLLAGKKLNLKGLIKKNGEKERNGLGLAIVKQILELHEGKIMAKSDEKQTDFLLVL